jgi:hypothetical protein
MNVKLITVLLATALGAACVGIKVRPEQAAQFAASQQAWRSYRWQEPPLDAAVRAHAERVLNARGYRQDPLAAQFEVDYRVGGETEVGLPGPASPNDFNEQLLAGPNAEYEVSSRFYTHRTLGYHEITHLRLTFFDVATQRIVWAATASRLVDNPQASTAKVGQIIGQAVDKMLADFPVAAR